MRHGQAVMKKIKHWFDVGDVGYKELNKSREFVIPGFTKMSVVSKPATEARSGVNPSTKEPMEFAAKPASKSVKVSPPEGC